MPLLLSRRYVSRFLSSAVRLGHRYYSLIYGDGWAKVYDGLNRQETGMVGQMPAHAHPWLHPCMIRVVNNKPLVPAFKVLLYLYFIKLVQLVGHKHSSHLNCIICFMENNS